MTSERSRFFERAQWENGSGVFTRCAFRDLFRVVFCTKTCFFVLQFKYAKISSRVNGSVKKGVVFATYSSLIGESTSSESKYRTRFKQLVHWLGKDFDGCVSFHFDYACFRPPPVCSSFSEGRLFLILMWWPGGQKSRKLNRYPIQNTNLQHKRKTTTSFRFCRLSFCRWNLWSCPNCSENDFRLRLTLMQIVFDECHRAKNLCPVGSSKPTKTGKTVLDLQNKLKKARIVYASATGVFYWLWRSQFADKDLQKKKLLSFLSNTLCHVYFRCFRTA